MDSDPPEIPVLPIPFEHGLPRFLQSITKGPATIVAIGSSTTAGEGNIPPYPGRLVSFLRDQYPTVGIIMINKGVSGQEAPAELQRFDTDVIANNPDLVIWQVGTNAIWQPADQHPPTFDQTTEAIRDGLAKLRDKTRADVILMDLQYLPAVLTPGKKNKALAMVEAISELARDTGVVNVFRRFEFMKSLYQIEQVSFDRMVDPGDDANRLHQSDWATGRVAWALKLAIVGGVDKARSSAAAMASSQSAPAAAPKSVPKSL